MKSLQKPPEQTMPSEAMAFMERFAGNRLTETETIFVAKFEHAADRFLPTPRLGSRSLPGRGKRLLSVKSAKMETSEAHQDGCSMVSVSEEAEAVLKTMRAGRVLVGAISDYGRPFAWNGRARGTT
jgi:hypothetical protein